ncbi:hypothetical protein F4775DRAFT_350186 [Biscogniauxia sp. FL1348]|nr:hypothetical protein F4775DRAFT_350186 [Biscogniauxia sp. FL1348]
MQISAMILGVFAAMAVAQSPFPSGFPDCGATCFNNMWALSSDLGCSGIDASCLCTKPDFAYGVRDCANESCSDHATEVIQFGSDWCAAQGIAIGGFPSASGGTVSPTTTVEATGSPITGSESGGASTEIVSTITNSDGSAVSTTTIATTSGSASGSGVSGTAVPVATTELVTTTTNSDGSESTSTFSTSTIFSSGAAGSGTESGSGTETGSASLTTITSESSFTSDGTTGVASITSTSTAAASETGGNGESTTGGEGATSTTAAGLAAQQTAAPVGLVAAAGLVFLML